MCNAMRPTAASVAALASPASIIPRRRLEKVKLPLVSAFHFSPFCEHAILRERYHGMAGLRIGSRFFSTERDTC